MEEDGFLPPKRDQREKKDIYDNKDSVEFYTAAGYLGTWK